MKKVTLSFVFFIVSISLSIGQNERLPYPVIFVHGLNSSDQAFATTMLFLKNTYNLGDINVYDVVLNADNDVSTSVMEDDVKWEDFYYGSHFINVGRRSYAENIDDVVDGWSGYNIFAINFKEERIRGANGFWGDLFDYSNQAAIYKQGYALSKMIKEVLDYTGADKVILVGHSMGGLAIREYLQRTDEHGTHINWIEPEKEDGHHVAKVITIGTPHLGSNTGFDPSKASVISSTSEAMRDLKWSYDSYPNCPNSAPVGIYLFGGNEHCIASNDDNETFDNVDINCNGNETDNIIGVDYQTYDNPIMPLPLNIPYVWVTSIWSGWNDLVGDGAVDINRQWLHIGNTPAPVGLADTLLMHAFHTSETDDITTILRAIDVPDSFKFAYRLGLDTSYTEFITFQPGMTPLDIDAFEVNTSGINAVNITLENFGSGIGRIEIYDENKNIIDNKEFFFLPFSFQDNISGNNKIYLKVYGYATPTTYLHPYQITVSSILSNIETNNNNLDIKYANDILFFSNQIQGTLSI